MNADARTCGVLNGLIEACYDDIRVQKDTAPMVGGLRRQRLEESAKRRVAFVNELSELVRQRGGKPEVAGSAFEGFRGALAKIHVVIVGASSANAYAACERVEAKAEALYASVTKLVLPAAAGEVVARQYAEIASDRQELRRCTMGM